MGKPIAGRGQWPFSINGIIVDGAKINNIVHFKDLFIYKQRSYNMYDLIDSNGVIYEYVRITYVDIDGDVLTYHTPSDILAAQIEDNHFFIKIQDITRNIFGFITLIQSNKVKVSTGDYIFIDDDMDLNLLTVRMNPSVVRTTRNTPFTISAAFLPVDYRNKSGTWTVEDPKTVHELNRTSNNVNTFVADEIGNTTIFFTPDGNKSLTTSCEVYVEENASEYSMWGTQIRGNDHKVVSGDTLTVVSIFFPFSYVPDDSMKIIISPDYKDDVYLEYIGTDDNINFKFKALNTTLSYGSYQYIHFQYHDVVSTVGVYVYPKKLIKYASMDGDRLIKPGQTSQWFLNLSPGEYFVGDIIWGVTPESVATIDQNGLLTGHSVGTYTLTTTIPGEKPLYTSGYVDNYIEEVVIGPMKNNVYVGDEIQLTCEFLPEGIYNGEYTWKIMPSPEDIDALKLENGNKLSVIRETSPAEYNQGVQLYVALPDDVHVKKEYTLSRTITSSTGPVPLEEIKLHSEWENNIYVSFGDTVSIGNFSFIPTNTTNKDITLTLSDESIAEIIFNEGELLSCTENVTYEVKGKAKGLTILTIQSVSNPEIKIQRSIVVY